MIRIGDIVIGHLDIIGGEFTYGNRIAIGNIFGDEKKGIYRRLKEAHSEIYGYSCRWLPKRWRYKRLTAMAEGIRFWVEQEQAKLNYTPTADELAAGIEELGKKVGALSTIKSLAKTFATDPDVILRWPYSKVFGFLHLELQESNFNRRFSAVIKNKANGKHSRSRK